MDDYLKQALEIVKAQASVRVMAEEEITSMVRTLAAHLKTMEDAPAEQEEAASVSWAAEAYIHIAVLVC